MANKQVNLIASFGYTDADGKEHYFTRQNQDEILEVIGEAELGDYVKSGVIEIIDSSEHDENIKRAFAPRGAGMRPSTDTSARATPSPTAQPAKPRRAGSEG